MGFNLWSYSPSSAAAVIFTILFGIAAIWHIAVCFRRHAWHFIPLVVCGICRSPLPSPSSHLEARKSHNLWLTCLEVETVGYVVRYLATKDQTNIGFYVIQTSSRPGRPGALCRLHLHDSGTPDPAAPCRDLAHQSRPSWLTKTFVGGDVLLFGCPAGGFFDAIEQFQPWENRSSSLRLVLQLLSVWALLPPYWSFTVPLWPENPTPMSYTMDDGKPKRISERRRAFPFYFTGALYSYPISSVSLSSPAATTLLSRRPKLPHMSAI